MIHVKPKQVNLRDYDFETGECEYCRYLFRNSICKVLAIKVRKDQVCNAYQGDDEKYKKFKISDVPAFARGMVRVQPYKHIVVKGLDTPIGFLVIIRDTMKPKPHFFSIDMKFNNEHLAREHHWTQKEVDKIVRAGKNAKLVIGGNG